MFSHLFYDCLLFLILLYNVNAVTMHNFWFHLLLCEDAFLGSVWSQSNIVGIKPSALNTSQKYETLALFKIDSGSFQAQHSARGLVQAGGQTFENMVIKCALFSS